MLMLLTGRLEKSMRALIGVGGLIAILCLEMSADSAMGKQIGPTDERKITDSSKEGIAKIVRELGITEQFAHQLFTSTGGVHCEFPEGHEILSAGLVNANYQVAINAHALVKKTKIGSNPVQYQCVPRTKKE